MKLPIWYKAKNGKWVTLTHFADGEIGLTADAAMRAGLYGGFGTDFGYLDYRTMFFTRGGDPKGRFLLREETKKQ